MKVSACMIVKNESKNIEKCIISYKEIVDEIVVVDTGSTDNTVEIAQGLGAKVLFRPWDNDFSAAKNYALEQVTGDWVIFLDADEYFVESSLSELERVLRKIDCNQKYDAVECPIYNINLYDSRIIEVAPTIRISRNRKDIRFVGKIHEAPKRKGEFLKVYRSNSILIHHTGYSSHIIKNKLERNLKILETEMNSDETDSLVYFYLAETCFSLEKYDNAIEYADQFSKCSDYAELIQTHPHVFRIYTFKIFSMLFLKNYYTQEDIYEVITESLEMVPFHPELKRNEADFYLSMGKLDEALTSFICAIELQEKYKHFHTNNFQRTMDDVLYKTGEIYYLKGDSDLALKYYYESLNAYKYNAKSFNRVLAEIKEKNPAEIISILNGIYDLKEFEDIEFISIHLAKNKMTIPFFYYFIKNWKWKYDDYGSLMSIALLLKGDSIKALRTSLSCYIKDKNAENERYIVISLVCGNHLDWYNKNKQVLSHKYQNILDVYFNVKDIQFFTEEEIKCCQNLLRELFTFENKQFFNNFMGKTPILVRESFEVIGDILKDNKCYEPAIDFYKKAILKQENNSIKTKLNFKLGFCYYHIKAYKESIDAFEKGLHSSDKINQNEFIQYLKWICEKEYDMKKRIEALIAKVEQR